MEIREINYNKSDYVVTTSGNKICRQTVLCGSQNIILQGKVIVQSEAIIRGDLANVKSGRYCIIGREAVIRPPYKKFSKGVAFFPLVIGDHVFVGDKSIINAAMVGSHVYIGKNCVIGRRCILKDCCVITDNTILAPETIVPPFAKFSGNPGVQIEEVPECQAELMVDFTTSYYQHFLPS